MTLLSFTTNRGPSSAHPSPSRTGNSNHLFPSRRKKNTFSLKARWCSSGKEMDPQQKPSLTGRGQQAHATQCQTQRDPSCPLPAPPSLQHLLSTGKIRYLLCQESLEYLPNGSLLDSTSYNLEGKKPPCPLDGSRGDIHPRLCWQEGAGIRPRHTTGSPHPAQTPSRSHARSPRTLMR